MYRGYFFWSGDGDLNPGPLIPETSVLPAELSPGFKDFITVGSCLQLFDYFRNKATSNNIVITI